MTIDYHPFPQARHRTSRFRTYDPSINKKKELAFLIKKQWKREPIDKPLSVHFRFSMPIPKSTSKKKTLEMHGKPHVKKTGDIDNILKACLDAMTWIVFTDDCLVYQVSGSKYYSKESPGIKIIIEVLGTST